MQIQAGQTVLKSIMLQGKGKGLGWGVLLVTSQIKKNVL